MTLEASPYQRTTAQNGGEEEERWIGRRAAALRLCGGHAALVPFQQPTDLGEVERRE